MSPIFSKASRYSSQAPSFTGTTEQIQEFLKASNSKKSEQQKKCPKMFLCIFLFFLKAHVKFGPSWESEWLKFMKKMKKIIMSNDWC